MKVAIAGAGIGGLCAALMLHARGIEVEIWESAAEIRPLGSGLMLMPQAVHELMELGLGNQLATLGVDIAAMCYFNRYGQQIWRDPRGHAAAANAPQYAINRGLLQVLLHNVTTDRLGAQAVHCGKAFESFEPEERGVLVRLRDPRTRTLTESRVDVLIGADGIFSAVRSFMYPIKDELRFSGRMIWRALAESEPLLDGRSAFMAGTRRQKFSCFPVSGSLHTRGRALLSWVAELQTGGAVPPKAEWNRRVDKALILRAFADWKWDWLDVPGLIESSREILEFPIVDRDPLPRWSFGPVTLLGDAAHPIYPTGHAGAAQAILDARYLADCLQSCSDPCEALREYEAERIPDTTALLLRHRMNGPEQVLQLAEARAPDGFNGSVQGIEEAELRRATQRFKEVAGINPERHMPN
ncbi:MAG: FAD-dependent monooxygenase [Rhodocyclaceae bacterium]|nr:FAD-dependent monooxygenase [Rhodocyclaceae bacterium]